MAITADRYLVSMGYKQLFGSQAHGDSELEGCYCLQQIESSFPDSKRLEYTDMSISDRYEWLSSLNQGKNCRTVECPIDLKPLKDFFSEFEVYNDFGGALPRSRVT